MVTKNNKFALKGEGTQNWAYFIPATTFGDRLIPNRVRVVAAPGWTGCYDDDLPIEEAREVYSKLLKRGWKKVNFKEATKIMAVQTLSDLICN